MTKLQQQSLRWLTGIIALVTVMAVSSCSGITPEGNLRNNREEGSRHGLFSGPDGEFVILAPASSGAEDKVEAEGTEPVKTQEKE